MRRKLQFETNINRIEEQQKRRKHNCQLKSIQLVTRVRNFCNQIEKYKMEQLQNGVLFQASNRF